MTALFSKSANYFADLVKRGKELNLLPPQKPVWFGCVWPVEARARVFPIPWRPGEFFIFEGCSHLCRSAHDRLWSFVLSRLLQQALFPNRSLSPPFKEEFLSGELLLRLFRPLAGGFAGPAGSLAGTGDFAPGERPGGWAVCGFFIPLGRQ
jgi:hypothetical protein